MSRVSPALRRRLDEAEFEAGKRWQARVVAATVAELSEVGETLRATVITHLQNDPDLRRPCANHRDAVTVILRRMAELVPDVAGRIAAQFDLAL